MEKGIIAEYAFIPFSICLATSFYLGGITDSRCYRSSGGESKLSICERIISHEGYPSSDSLQKAWT